jgi:hypothetical protein
MVIKIRVLYAENLVILGRFLTLKINHFHSLLLSNSKFSRQKQQKRKLLATRVYRWEHSDSDTSSLIRLYFFDLLLKYPSQF